MLEKQSMTWVKAQERCAYNDRTFPDAPGVGGGKLNGENVSTGRERTSGTARKHEHTAAKSIARNPRPHTGKGDWAEGEDRSGYSDAVALVISLAAKGTPKQRKLADACKELTAERKRDAKFGDVPAARIARLEAHIRAEADFLAGVTTGDRNRAALVAEAARRVAA